MRRILMAGLLSIAVLVSGAGSASAQTTCPEGQLLQTDMAGGYASADRRLLIEMYPCGGTLIQWDNEYGRHTAGYNSVSRIPDGGVAARSMVPDWTVGYLDNAPIVGFRHTEDGFLQVGTFTASGQMIRMYRLRKV